MSQYCQEILCPISKEFNCENLTEVWPVFLAASASLMKCCHTGNVWSKGRLNFPGLFLIRRVHTHAGVWLRGGMERCQPPIFCGPIVAFHCRAAFIFFFLYEEGGEAVSPPRHLKKKKKRPKKKKLCYFKADVWSTWHNKNRVNASTELWRQYISVTQCMLCITEAAGSWGKKTHQCARNCT